MTPVDQTQFKPEVGDEAGNCMQACVASLLELPLAAVPNFAADRDERWYIRYLDWLQDRGFWVATMAEPATPDAVGFAIGDSPRGAWKHMVIVRGDSVWHDPHPSRAGLTTVDRYEYLVPVVPGAAMRFERTASPSGELLIPGGGAA